MRGVQGTLDEMDVNKKLNIYGNMNNDDGHLLFKNATMLSGKILLHNIGIATYDSQQGDSGAPIIHHTENDESKLIGVHHGGVCYFDPKISGHTEPIDVRGKVKWCQENNFYYKVFSAWENVKKQLRLQ